ncbi:L-threonylcarbamoyladenylate synthase type 1 TsaC [Bowmanella dokdonensis]|uniref:Threonylcarbamoyl-AMP synthase n=1 Tax=Bowmanella dokdonensis TaxID=751969 RepID=A0A939IRQ6_9ALTE|nr:Sua5/YciO/YrdC/YwlC family protein [Bowmanella dokdonensis]MBN7825902.1 Sua5/YciO/YrdC/YwlC family protein [Bowmanella dokdonensis]
MSFNWQPALKEAFQQGAVLAYPTEAVYGLGCDPDNEEAVMQLLALKNRPVEKGLILIASNYSQLLPYVKDSAIPMDRRTEIVSSWPGPFTWLLPKSLAAPDWITGGSDLVAVRVSAHPLVRDLCDFFGKALVSTSANLAGEEPARTAQQVEEAFRDQVLIVDGAVGAHAQPSQIRHGLTGQLIRA